MRGWGFTAVLLPFALVYACSDDLADDRASQDAGQDAPSYSSSLPPLPIFCVAAGTFDPCDAGLDPSVYGATLSDGGRLADNDAGAWSDAGRVASACVASGAVRVACPDDAGVVRFDLVANDDGSSEAVASAKEASRFTIAADGNVSAMTAIPNYGAETRIVKSAAGIATITARTRNRFIGLRRPGIDHDESVSLTSGEIAESFAFHGAGMADDGTISVLLNGPGLVRVPGNYDGINVERPTLDRPATALWTGAQGGWQTAGADFGGFVLAQSQSSQLVSASTNVVATTVSAANHPLVAGEHDRAIEIYAGKDFRSSDWIRMRVQRESRCYGSGTGCGGRCTESVHEYRPGSGGSFVHLANGNDYFVYAERFVTRDRVSTTDRDIPCSIFGGCGCKEKVENEVLGAVDAVVLQISESPYQLNERARVHLSLSRQSTIASDTTPGAGLKALARGSQIHVLYQGNGSEMARVVLDLDK